jgi:hypothetical protein
MNLVDRIKIKSNAQQELQSTIPCLGGSANIESFAEMLENLFQFHEDDNLVGYRIGLYLLQIHPIHWKFFGTRPSQKDKELNASEDEETLCSIGMSKIDKTVFLRLQVSHVLL